MKQELTSIPSDDMPLEVIDVYTSDRAAVSAWLQSKPNASHHSIRAYRQAVGILTEWLQRQHGGSLEHDTLLKLGTVEAQNFTRFLQSPEGARRGPRSSKRNIPRTEGDALLAAKTVRQRITILASMYAYWMQPRDGGRAIVTFNPFHGLPASIPDDAQGNTGAQRSLSKEEQGIVSLVLDALPRNTPSEKKHYWRAKLIWTLASRLALRRFEIAALKVSDIRKSNSGNWKLELRGKARKSNQKPDIVLVPESVIEIVREYLGAFGLHPEPLPSNNSQLIRHIKTGHRLDHVSDGHVARIMKEIFAMAADHAERVLRKPHLAPRLRQASIHWGRHTWFMNSLAAENKLHLVSLAGRHKDIRTTMKSYVGVTEEDLAYVMNSTAK